MKVTFLPALLVVVLVGSVAEGITAQSRSPESTVAGRSPALASREAKDPFANLFRNQLNLTTKLLSPVAPPIFSAAPTQAADRHPAVVCGMTVVPVDPRFDAAMRHVVPDTGPKFTIRLVPPGMCGQ